MAAKNGKKFVNNLMVKTVEEEFGKDLVGRQFTLDILQCSENDGLQEGYPFKGQSVPVTVIQVTRTDLIVRVETHMNKTLSLRNFGDSHPYIVSVPKMYLHLGQFIMRDIHTKQSIAQNIA